MLPLYDRGPDLVYRSSPQLTSRAFFDLFYNFTTDFRTSP